MSQKPGHHLTGIDVENPTTSAELLLFDATVTDAVEFQKYGTHDKRVKLVRRNGADSSYSPVMIPNRPRSTSIEHPVTVHVWPYVYWVGNTLIHFSMGH